MNLIKLKKSNYHVNDQIKKNYKRFDRIIIRDKSYKTGLLYAFIYIKNIFILNYFM